MKSFKTLMSEVAEPLSPEEKAFKDQHTIQKFPHPAAEDGQFTGEIKGNLGTTTRIADQKGDANYDQAYNEEVEFPTAQLDEKLSADDDMGTWVKDFKDSDAPQFKGKSMKKRAQMAVAAKLAANRNESYVAEAEEDDEPASPDEGSMAKKQCEFIQYVGREVAEHIAGGKEFPEWMQNKLSAVHQAAKDLHATLGDHGKDDMDEGWKKGYKKEELSDKQKKIDHNKNGKIDGHDLAMLRSKKKNESVEQLDELVPLVPAAIAAGTAAAAGGIAYGAKKAIDAKKTIDSNKANKNQPRPNATKTEEVELDEIKNVDLKIHRAASKMARDLHKKNTHEKGIKKALEIHFPSANHKAIMHGLKNEEVELDEAAVSTIAKAHGFVKHNSGMHKGSFVHPKTGETIAALGKERNGFGHSRKDGSTITTGYKDGLEKHLASRGYKKTTNEEVELDETTMSATKKPVNITGPDGKTRTVYKRSRVNDTDEHGLDKIKTNEEVDILDETFKQGILKLKDKSSVVLKKEDAAALNHMFKGMSKNNMTRMTNEAMKNKKSFEEILSFAKDAD